MAIRRTGLFKVMFRFLLCRKAIYLLLSSQAISCLT
jgi:hypothetical protein